MSLNKGITTRIKTTNNFLFTCEKIECEVSSFETISLAFKSGQSWRLKIFPLVPPLVFGLMMKNFRKLPFGTPLKNFLQLILQKGLASLIVSVKQPFSQNNES
jgi:hypothetical protein